MTDKTFSAENYLNGSAELPAGFDTGYRHHLEVARDIVRRRKVAVIETTAASNCPPEEPSGAPAAA